MPLNQDDVAILRASFMIHLGLFLINKGASLSQENQKDQEVVAEDAAATGTTTGHVLEKTTVVKTNLSRLKAPSHPC